MNVLKGQIYIYILILLFSHHKNPEIQTKSDLW